MSNLEQLGKNIRALRKAYGETQEELGFALNVGKNTVSYYETAAREPDKETLTKIAKHYQVSVEELLSCDFGDLGNISIDPLAFWKNIEIVFPLISSEKALNNDSFKNAFENHNEMYKSFHMVSMNGIDKLDKCAEGYIDAFEDETSKEESAANFIALMYFLKMIWKRTPEVLNNRPASLTQISSKNPKYREVLDNPNSDLKKDADELLDFFDDPEITDLIEEMLTVIKHSHKYADVADYYLSLQFIYNIVDNGLEVEFNQRIGVEMLNSFIMVGNPYAARYMKFNIDSLQGSSQSVDDK